MGQEGSGPEAEWRDSRAPSSQGLHRPRPFYLIGHNTNSIPQVRDGLGRGLNAFEIDIHKDEHDRLYVSHDPVSSSPAFWTKPAPPLDAFLAELRDLSSSPAGSGVALVIFDCKIADSALGAELLRSVRTHLTQELTALPVIFSVPSLEHARTFFERVHAELDPREGLMIDEEDDPRAVAAFFAERRVEHAAYGNGITTAIGLELLGPRLISQMDAAVALMAEGHFRFVYPWVLAARTTMRAFMRTGVNGIMTDVDDGGTLVDVLDREFSFELRRAVRADDPFAERPALVLEVVTADVPHAGTDATVSFELTLADGSTLRRSVDAAFNGRFERGGVTTVTLPGVELAPEQVRSITVTHDGGGLGADWRLHSVIVRSRLGPAREACFERELTEGARVTQTFNAP